MMASFPIKCFLAGVWVVVFIGCASAPESLYYWGEYEDIIYDTYLEPGKSSLTDQILRLEEQVEQAAANGKPVPPGIYAHLGYLYTSDGDYNSAVINYQREKEEFPESADFINGILRRMKK